MHRKILLSILAIATSPALLAQEVQMPKEASEQAKKLLPYQIEFTNLPEKTRTEFLKHHREAARLFAEKRIFESFEALRLAEQSFKGTPEVFNLRGSCYVELRAFDKALECFKKAVELSPENYSILFNIGEVYFVTQDWQSAHDAFDKLLKNMPENRGDLLRITEFKLMLCKLKLGNPQEAEILANKYDFLDDSPYHYFAMAVLSYEKDDVADAEKWIARAARIFRNPAVLAPWHDTLVEYGYIKSFYGGQPEAGE